MNNDKFRDWLISLVASGTKMTEIARKSGVTYNRVRDLKRRHSQSTNPEAAAAIARAFGKSLSDFSDETEVPEWDNPRFQELVEMLRQADPTTREMVGAVLEKAESLRKNEGS